MCFVVAPEIHSGATIFRIEFGVKNDESYNLFEIRTASDMAYNFAVTPLCRNLLCFLISNAAVSSCSKCCRLQLRILPCNWVLRAASSEVNDASPCLPALENSVYVDYINTFAARYGTMNGIHNVNLDGKDEWNLLYLQGTLKEINTKNENILHESINGEMYYMPRKVAVLTLKLPILFLDILS